jgi:hypothetical protein
MSHWPNSQMQKTTREMIPWHAFWPASNLERWAAILEEGSREKRRSRHAKT